MGLEAKRPDEDLNMKTTLCQMCSNRRIHEYDSRHPEKSTVTCAAMGSIPRALLLGETFECSLFTLDDEKCEMYIELLAGSFEPDI